MMNARSLLRGLLAATTATAMLGGPASADYVYRYPIKGAAVVGQNTDRPVAWTPTTDLGQASRGSAFSRVLEAASDPDNDPIAYTVQGALPAGLAFDPATRVVSGTPTAVGVQSFVIRAAANTAQVDRTFTLTVVAPTAMSSASCAPGVFDAANNVCVFSVTGALQSWTVPAGISRMGAMLWGAGGGGATSAGGGGGYATGAFAVSAGETLLFVVGQGGQRGMVMAGGAASYGGGGAGASANGGFKGGGAGGGLAGIFRGSVSQAGALLIAGGGGGAGQAPSEWSRGGAGGGATGQAGANPGCNPGGGGGSQSAGGAGGGTGAAGGALQGGAGHNNGAQHGGAGGGGGYFGGGGTQNGNGWLQCNYGSSGGESAGAGGGSSYAAAGVGSVALVGGSAAAPGAADDPRRGTAGQGGAMDGDGAVARIVIAW